MVFTRPVGALWAAPLNLLKDTQRDKESFFSYCTYIKEVCVADSEKQASQPTSSAPDFIVSTFKTLNMHALFILRFPSLSNSYCSSASVATLYQISTHDLFFHQLSHCINFILLRPHFNASLTPHSLRLGALNKFILQQSDHHNQSQYAL